ncbi:MAG: ABC transporter ATP-binding protein [Hyphomonas sp.]|nr:ABC transporter ATP-binding protein [Hyphomonas sp.]
MAELEAKNLCVHFPLNESGTFSGGAAPANLVTIGSKRFIFALRDVSFHVAKGTKLGIVGRNGSGKSTLLRVLGNVYTPTGGSLRVTGNVSSLFNINLGAQPDVSGRQNILLRGLVKGWTSDEVRERMPEIIEFSELGEFIDLPIRTYSDGMRMRLLFAIATAFSPEILLLDEWIGAGDSNFQKKAAARMNALVDGAGITVIASHNRGLLKRVCDFGMWLDHGVMRAFGPIDEVYEKMDDYFASQGA